MKAKRTNLELIAPSVEEAIHNGLQELGLQREDVEIEVLDEGARGLFGLGSRQARIRMTIKEPGSVNFSEKPIQKPEFSDLLDFDTAEELDLPPLEAALELTEELESEDTIPPTEGLMEDLTFQVVRETVLELLGMMNFNAEVSLRYGEVDERRNRPPIHVDIHGDDLSMLIGKRAETLNAFQYIASLIVTKELGRFVSLVVDVEGYRERRHNQVRQIAKRMAEQAIRTGRRQVLEPMPASERRIIHIELRNYPNLKTESIGEEPYRKVTIIPT
jgi:spoIIIJ-associated protein